MQHDGRTVEIHKLLFSVSQEEKRNSKTTNLKQEKNGFKLKENLKASAPLVKRWEVVIRGNYIKINLRLTEILQQVKIFFF